MKTATNQLQPHAETVNCVNRERRCTIWHFPFQAVFVMTSCLIIFVGGCEKLYKPSPEGVENREQFDNQFSLGLEMAKKEEYLRAKATFDPDGLLSEIMDGEPVLPLNSFENMHHELVAVANCGFANILCEILGNTKAEPPDVTIVQNMVDIWSKQEILYSRMSQIENLLENEHIDVSIFKTIAALEEKMDYCKTHPTDISHDDVEDIDDVIGKGSSLLDTVARFLAYELGVAAHNNWIDQKRESMITARMSMNVLDNKDPDAITTPSNSEVVNCQIYFHGKLVGRPEFYQEIKGSYGVIHDKYGEKPWVGLVVCNIYIAG